MAYLSLRRVLWLDLISCAAFGLLIATGSGVVDRLTGIPSLLLLDAGLVLIAMAGWIGFMLTRRELPRGQVRLLIGINLLWVAASLILPALVTLGGAGMALVLAQAVAVAATAILQSVALRANAAPRRAGMPG